MVVLYCRKTQASTAASKMLNGAKAAGKKPSAGNSGRFVDYLQPLGHCRA